MTHSTVMNADKASSGSEIPSIATWYRLLMTGIHSLFDVELASTLERS